MSRNTEPLPAIRHRALAVVCAVIFALVPVAAATPASSAPGTWAISGTIGNWDASLIGTQVDIYYDDGSTVGLLIDGFALTGPSFTSDPLDADPVGAAPAGRYTLHFDVDDTVEYIDGYLGEKLNEEYPDVAWLDADSVGDVDAGVVDLIEAQYISGTVTGNGSPVDGATIYADVEDIVLATGWLMEFPFETTSDTSGSTPSRSQPAAVISSPRRTLTGRRRRISTTMGAAATTTRSSRPPRPHRDRRASISTCWNPTRTCSDLRERVISTLVAPLFRASTCTSTGR